VIAWLLAVILALFLFCLSVVALTLSIFLYAVYTNRREF